MPEKTILNNGKEVTYTYDTLGRLTGKVLNTTTPLNFAYTYEVSDRGSGYTTTKVETEQIGDTTYKYTYDVYGNITCIYKVNSDNTETLLCSYVYDNYNQLTTVNDYEHSEQTTYTYNQAGNITRRNRYQMNSSWVTTATLENVRYVYGDSEWKDLLTTYNGQTITYDAIGNPLNYRDGISLTWQKGRQLASYSDSNNNITYTYDASGMRTGKAVTNSSGATTNYSYVYENGLLQKMTRGSRILEFSYDANGTPVSIKYRSSETANPVYYYYGINSRGDVTSLYNSDGSVAAIYSYDAYGKLLSVKTSAGIDITGSTSIAILNPLRYRSYVYDNETGFYYLQTRYYDPTICRFINADGQLSTQDINCMNLFSYCSNNPVNRIDSTGEAWWHWALGAAIVAVCAAATVVTCGGFAAAAGAVAAVSCGVAAATTASTIAAGAFIGSATVFGVAAVSAAATSSSVQEFCDKGNWGTVAATAGGAFFGGAGASLLSSSPSSSSATKYPPNDGFNATPRESVLATGSQLQRVGGTSGRFVAPINTSFSSLSLPPDKIGAPIMNLEVLRPIPVQAGTAMPWFGQPGGGTQFLLPDKIQHLIENGSLRIMP